MNILNTKDKLSSPKKKIKNSAGKRERLIVLFVIGLICYQYIPFSSMAGYLLGTLVTSLFVVGVILGGCFYLSRSYGWVLTIIFKVWVSSTEKEEKEKEKEMRAVILKKCDEVVKELKDNGDRIKILEKEKLQEEKLQEEKLQEEKLQEEKLQEEKLQEKDDDCREYYCGNE